MKKAIFIFFFFLPLLSHSQQSQAEILLEKSIDYHDPDGNWASFTGTLLIDQEIPGRPIRNTRIFMDNTSSFFSHEQVRNDTLFTRLVIQDECSFKMEGQDISQSEANILKLDCERSKRLRNYYSYLYGLPMKLKDPGTILHPDVNETSFNGKQVNSIRVSYEVGVGEDTWYFYFSPENSRLVGYRFYHDETKNDGEYIILEKEKIIDHIKIPAIRTWYVNKDKKLLGTDFLK